jgi:hypothetical protein
MPLSARQMRGIVRASSLAINLASRGALAGSAPHDRQAGAGALDLIWGAVSLWMP